MTLMYWDEVQAVHPFLVLKIGGSSVVRSFFTEAGSKSLLQLYDNWDRKKGPIWWKINPLRYRKGLRWLKHESIFNRKINFLSLKNANICCCAFKSLGKEMGQCGFTLYYLVKGRGNGKKKRKGQSPCLILIAEWINFDFRHLFACYST